VVHAHSHPSNWARISGDSWGRRLPAPSAQHWDPAAPMQHLGWGTEQVGGPPAPARARGLTSVATMQATAVPAVRTQLVTAAPSWELNQRVLALLCREPASSASKAPQVSQGRAEPASSKRSLGDSRSAGPREVRRCRAGGGRRQRGNVAPSSAAGGPTRSSMPPPMHARMRGPCSAELAAMPRQLFLPCTRDWFAPAGTYGTRSCRYSLRAVKKHCEAHSAAGSS
jgi:hypothetical protein